MIQKLQTGGTALATHIAAPLRQTATKTTSTADDELISKDLLKLLNGIPVDVDNLMELIADLEYEHSLGMPVSAKTVRSILARINRISQLSKYLTDAENRAVKNEAVGEIAVGDQGQLYTLTDTGDIKAISISEYDIDKHGPAMTVNLLIEHRKFNPTQAYDSSLTLVIGNNIGTSKISDYIHKIIESIGTSSTSNEAYTDLAGLIGREAAKKPTESQLLTIQQLYQMSQKIGMDAIFKDKNVFKSKNVQEALIYINNILPRNMRLLLQSRFVANGIPFSQSAESVSALIGNALMSMNDIEQSAKIDYDSGANKAAGTTSGGKLEQKRNLKAIETLVLGSLNKVDYNITSSKNPSVGMTLHGNRIGALTNFDNNIVPKSPMSVAIESSIGPLIDKLHITMGSQKIDESMFDTIMYDGNDVINVWAPVDNNGDVDLMGLQQFNEILLYFDSDPSLTVADKNRVLSEYGIQGRINENGEFVGSGNMALFLVVTGITSDKVINKDDDFVEVLDGDKKKFELDQIERVYGYINSKNKNKHGDLEFKKGLFTDIVKAPIFMRLKSTALTEVGTFANHGPLAWTPTYAQQVTADQLNYNQQNLQQPFYQPSSSLILQ